MTSPPTSQAQPIPSGPPERDARSARLIGRITTATAAAALLVLAAGCGSIPLLSGPTAADRPGTAQPGGLPQLPKDAAPVDACALLTTEEVIELIGDHEVNPDPNLGGGACSWVNRGTYDSVTVRIGRSGSAINGKLPEESIYGPTQPGPDGVRFAPGGITEFVADDRACEIQLVTGHAPAVADSIAVRLVGLVRSRI